MSKLLLQGIRIADFGRLVAVPFATQVLGWLGAEVILVESRRHMTHRILPPFAEATAGVNRSGAFNLFNANKLSLTLNLHTREGIELAKRLTAMSDVVMENFATGTMEKLGLGYETVRRLKPDIIYLSLSAFGRTGPMKDYVGFHSVINLFSGLAAVTGYPGGHPRILGGVFPDLFSGCYCLLAVVEALYHRAKTGEGQYIELAMTEALTTLIPEAVADYTLNGREVERVGNRDRDKAPHNVYRCKGDQRWVALSVATEAQWQALCQAAEHPEWATDPRFSEATRRQENQEALDALMETWTRKHESSQVMEMLQRAGVPAAAVLDAGELLRDPHLRERDFVAWVDHPEVGRRALNTLAWTMDGARPAEYRRAPLLGEHNEYVLRELLELSPEEIHRLKESGVLT